MAAGIPVAVAFAVYLPALHNGFVWDDPTVLQQIRAIRSVHDLFVLPPIIPHFYYRPLIFVTYLLDRALGGGSPFWFHASVLAWHALNTLLVFLLADLLFPADWLIASGAALLFAVFPTHVESVAWMAGRSDVIACAFMLLTVLMFARRKRSWTAWLGSLAFLAAMLSKESAIACVVLIPLLDLLSAGRLIWLRYVPLAGATALYFLLRDHALGAYIGGIPSTVPSAQLALDLLHAVGFYVVHAVVPAPLSAYIPQVPTNPLYLLAGSVVPLAALILAFTAWHRGRWQPAYLVLWFFITLAPSLTVIIRRSASALVADRYLYVPTAASCMLLAWALVRLAQRRNVSAKWVGATILALSVVFALEVVPYTRVWTNNLTFWTDIVTKVPDDAMPHRALAEALQNDGRLTDAEQQLRVALSLPSDTAERAMSYSNLGNLYRRLKRYLEAEAALDAAIKLAPNNPAFYHNLGMALMMKTEQDQQRGDQDALLPDITKARSALESALKLGSLPGARVAFPNWDPAKTHALLGQVLFSLGDRAAARAHLEEALRLEPTGPIADLTRQYLQRLSP